MNAPVVAEIREVIKASPIKADITDLHVWRVGKGNYACVLAVAVADAAKPDDFRCQLSIHEELVHVTVEVNRLDLLTRTVLPSGGLLNRSPQ